MLKYLFFSMISIFAINSLTAFAAGPSYICVGAVKKEIRQSFTELDLAWSKAEKREWSKHRQAEGPGRWLSESIRFKKILFRWLNGKHLNYSYLDDVRVDAELLAHPKMNAKLSKYMAERDKALQALPAARINELKGQTEKDPIDPTLRVTLSKSPFQKCVFHVDEWRFDKNPDDLILLYGNLGIGKSTLLSALESHFQQTLVVRKVVLKDKIIHRKAFFETLSQVFETEVKSLSDFEKLDKSSKKTLLILDDIHNLYLNVVGGLEAYRTLIELTSLQLENIFWCLSCNERALAHLNGLFGTDHFTGPKIEIMSWTDSEIQDLIVRRHRQSLYQLKFDQVISAVHRGDILESSSGVEVQFFRLLWGQSRGNPSTAQELWLSAATKESNNSIRITVPEFTNPKTLSDLSDETLIIYAAITKHEALSFREIRDICKIPVPIIRQSIKFGEDGMILESIKGGRWRIHPKAQYVVHAQLIGRNFIYG